MDTRSPENTGSEHSGPDRPPGANSVLTPTYWGSLLALLLGLLLTLMGAIFSGVPQHVEKLPDEVALPLFVMSLLFVSIFTLRYYIAVCVNVYGNTQGSISNWPPWLKKVAFFLLCVLVAFSVTSVAALAAVGIAESLYLCIGVSLISLFVFVICWSLKHVNEDKYGYIETTFGAGDAFFTVVIGWVVLNLLDPSVEAVIGMSILLFLGGLITIVEFYRKYMSSLLQQLQFLWRWLDEPADRTGT